jgi:hypothetical protein
MSHRFERWKALSRCMEQGSLHFVDLVFAASVLKKLNSDKEEHAALLAVLFALSRQGHLTLDISKGALESALRHLTLKEVGFFADLVERGAASFPPHGIADVVDEPSSTWICRRGSYYYLQKN